MRRGRGLLGLAVGLDLAGAVLGVAVAVRMRASELAIASPLGGLVCVLIFLVLSWFFGGYSFLRWPWMPLLQQVQSWLLVVFSTIALTALLFGSSVFLPGLVLALWGLLMRFWLRPWACTRRSDSALAGLSSVPAESGRRLLLIFVAYHPSEAEVNQLQACLALLPPELGYAVVVNDHRSGEPVERLSADADFFLTNSDNPGYGRAVNRLVARLDQLPPYLGVLNTDLSWSQGTFEPLLGWLEQNPDVTLAVPQILDEEGTPQKLCKRHPTVLGLFSRRFLPQACKPSWLKRYDRWYVMANQDYREMFEAPYLSGCCMLLKTDAFLRAGGFDERYFLYLEDADLTRTLARDGRCVHLPLAAVVHGWGRGNYRNLRLMLVNLCSAWHYFRKWGWALW